MFTHNNLPVHFDASQKVVEDTPCAFVKYKSGPSPVNFYPNNLSAWIQLNQGDKVKAPAAMFAGGEKFRSFAIENTVATPIDTVFIFGDGDFEEQVVISGGSTGAMQQWKLLDSAPQNPPQPLVSTLNVRDLGYTYGNVYVDNVPMGAPAVGVFKLVIDPASNTEGAILWACTGWVTFAAAGASAALLAKSNAPATIIDGALVLVGKMRAQGALFIAEYELAKPIVLNPGAGLFLKSSAAEVACLRSFFYSLF